LHTNRIALSSPKIYQFKNNHPLTLFNVTKQKSFEISALVFFKKRLLSRLQIEFGSNAMFGSALLNFPNPKVDQTGID
jgi:hypothetical protein